jgi:hypothetical protein
VTASRSAEFDAGVAYLDELKARARQDGGALVPERLIARVAKITCQHSRARHRRPVRLRLSARQAFALRPQTLLDGLVTQLAPALVPIHEVPAAHTFEVRSARELPRAGIGTLPRGAAGRPLYASRTAGSCAGGRAGKTPLIVLIVRCRTWSAPTTSVRL